VRGTLCRFLPTSFLVSFVLDSVRSSIFSQSNQNFYLSFSHVPSRSLSLSFPCLNRSTALRDRSVPPCPVPNPSHRVIALTTMPRDASDGVTPPLSPPLIHRGLLWTPTGGGKWKTFIRVRGFDADHPKRCGENAVSVPLPSRTCCPPFQVPIPFLVFTRVRFSFPRYNASIQSCQLRCRESTEAEKQMNDELDSPK
jgi:hypothetical protein